MSLKGRKGATMINFLDLLGIHVYDIEMTEEHIMDVFEELDIDMDSSKLAEKTESHLCEYDTIDGLGNKIIESMLSAAERLLRDAVKPYEPKSINLYVNGADSRFAVGEEDKTVIKTANKSGYPYGFIKWLNNQLGAEDVDYVFEVEGLPEILKKCFDSKIVILWSSEEDVALSDKEIEAIEKRCLSNPEDIDKVIFVGTSGNVYESSLFHADAKISVDWDTDNESPDGLPKEVILEDISVLDDIADRLSDEYGFLVNSYEIKEII